LTFHQDTIKLPNEDRTELLDIAAGALHSAVLTEKGLYTFGNNDLGQLGRPTPIEVYKKSTGSHKEAREEDKNSSLFPFAVTIPTLTPITQVSCGGFHTAAVCRDGHAYAWGCNSHGQLGIGDRRVYSVSNPMPISGLTQTRVRKISCGFRHTAVIVDDLMEDVPGIQQQGIGTPRTSGKGLGRVYTFGSNEFGELGIVPPACSPIPHSKKTFTSVIPKLEGKFTFLLFLPGRLTICKAIVHSRLC